MNICPNCKNSVDAEDKFCTHCGTALQAAQPEPVEAEKPAEQNQSVFMKAGLDGQPLTPNSDIETHETFDREVPPHYAYPPYDQTGPQKKKSVLPIVLAAIGGVVLVGIVITVLLCFVLCGGNHSLKWGMTRSEVVSVMVKEGFVPEDDLEDAGEEFEGYIKDGGEVDIDCMYNENGELFYVAIHGESDGRLDAVLDKKFGKYKNGVVMGSTIRYKEKGKTFSMREMGSTETFWISLDHAPQDALVAIEMVRAQVN